MRVIYFKIKLMLIMILFNVISVYALTNYVDGINGDNLNGGTSWADAWQTIGHGVTNISSGDTLLISASIYTEEVIFPNSGSSGNLIYINEYTNGVIVDGQNVRANCFSINGKSYIYIKGIKCKNVFGSAFSLINSTNIYIISNNFSSEMISLNNSINNHILYNSGDINLQNQCNSNEIKYNNLSIGKRISLSGACSYNFIFKNKCRGGGIQGSLYINSSCKFNTIMSNLIHGASSSGIIIKANNDYNKIIGNSINNNEWYAIEFQDNNNDHNIIQRNSIVNKNNRLHIFFNSVGNHSTLVCSNTFSGSSGGIGGNFGANSGHKILNNTFDFGASTGVINVGSSCQIYYNDIDNGIVYLRGSSVAYHNEIYNCTTGISSIGANNKVIRNLLYNYSGTGINLDANSAAVENNTCVGNGVASTGISLGAGNSSKIKNSITYNNNVGINGPGSVILSNCCINDGYAGGVSPGPGCITNNPLFKDVSFADYYLRWNSPCINTAQSNTVAGCMGAYPSSLSPVYDNTNWQSTHYVTFNTPVIGSGIPDNAEIEIEYTNSGGATTFNLDNITKVSTTSYWGGGMPTFNFVGSTAQQKITVTRSGGNTSAAGQTENIIFYNITNTFLPATNYQVRITVKTNGKVMFKDLSNDFRIWHSPFVCLNKTIESNTLSGEPSNSIPGSTLKYKICFDNDGDNWARVVEIIDTIPSQTTYFSNSASYTLNSGLSAKIEYYSGGSWHTTDQGCATTKIKWKINPFINPNDNSEGTDFIGICDGEFPDTDSGILSFKVIIK